MALRIARWSPAAANRAYTIAGGEVLTYRAMVQRIFASMGKRPLTPSVPLGAFRLTVACLRLISRYRHWTPSMAVRMNADLVFEPPEALRDFGYAPGRFEPGPFA